MSLGFDVRRIWGNQLSARQDNSLVIPFLEQARIDGQISFRQRFHFHKAGARQHMNHPFSSSAENYLKGPKRPTNIVNLFFAQIPRPGTDMEEAMNEKVPLRFQPSKVIEVSGSDTVFGKN